MLFLYLLVALVVGWFVIKLAVGILRIFLILLLILILAGIAMGNGEITTVTTTQSGNL